MRINDCRLTGPNAGQTERTNETGDASLQSRDRVREREGDRIEMSSFTGRLFQFLRTDGEQRQARVEQLSSVFAAGKLDVAPVRVSGKIVDSMLGAT